jgi:hypothetical protein
MYVALSAVLQYLMEYLHAGAFPPAKPNHGLDILKLLQLRSLAQQYQLPAAMPLVDSLFCDGSGRHGGLPSLGLSTAALMTAMGSLVDPDTYDSILWRWLDAAALLHSLKDAAAMIAAASPIKGSSVVPEQAATAEGTKESFAAEATQGAAGTAGSEDALLFSNMSVEGLQLFLQFGFCSFLDQTRVLAAVLEWSRNWSNKLQTSGMADALQDQQEGPAPASGSSTKATAVETPTAVLALLSQLQWHKMDPAALQVLAGYGDLLDIKTMAGTMVPRKWP